ncbi:MAG: PQQ-binding-like beta-propeller repeat protein, partial [Halocynthiibacter sp.]
MREIPLSHPFDDDKLKEECGVFGVIGAAEAANFVALGLHALQYDPARRTVNLLWHQPQLRSENASPVVHDGRAYTVKASGILVCGDAASGEVLWRLRLRLGKGALWATPVLVGGHLYCVSHDGVVGVVQLDSEMGKVVGTSQIDPAILASPAVA